jgi:hypothetical protein
MQIVGTNLQPQVEGLEELPGKINYFIGNDPVQWRTNIPTYAKVKYYDVYSGVDLVYYGNQRQLEYDFIVAPGVDPATVILSFQDQNGQLVPVHVNEDNALVLRLADGEVHFRKPLVYQEVNGVRREVAGTYLLRNTQHAAPDASQIGFQVASYDVTKPLIIDPVLEYSTYLGGSLGDQGEGIAVDGAGNTYVTGSTSSLSLPPSYVGFPLLYPLSESWQYGGAFVTSFDATGTLRYSTYLAGNQSGVLDEGHGIAVDTSGNAYVTGRARTPNFPTAPKSGTTCLAYQCTRAGSSGSDDAFLSKLSPQGNSLLYSTYFGGGGGEQGNGIAVDANNNVYIVGQSSPSSSPLFPTKNPVPDAAGGNLDAFVAKFNLVGGTASQPHNEDDLVYSTLLGGSGSDIAYDVAVDGNGSAYVTGRTDGPSVGVNGVPPKDFPLINAYQMSANGNGTGGQADAFAAKLSATGSSLDYSTYLGGSNGDEGAAVAVDSNGNAYVTGWTASIVGSGQIAFPLVNPLQTNNGGVSDAFLTKITPTGSVVYSSYVGGNRTDRARGIALDLSGSVYLTGWTALYSSPDNFFNLNPLQSCTSNSDAFVIKLKPTADLKYAPEYATCLGGTNTDQGNAIAVDTLGNAYITGYTVSIDFPTVSPYQGSLSGNTGTNFGNYNDAFVAKISTDSDSDLDGYSTAQGDCADDNDAIHPGAPELCNGIDDNCINGVDEPFAVGTSCNVGTGACQRTGTTVCASGGPTTQCNATPGTANPETCNGVDDDCNGLVDDNTVETGQICSTGQPGICSTGTNACSTPGMLTCQGQSPTAEICNGLDDDCNGSIPTDEADSDGDTVRACNGDCNDADNTIYPGAPELRDGKDNDCDGIIAATELDEDGDGINDAADNCPQTMNADQADNDADTLGDACDLDDDNDTVADNVDNCALVANTEQQNADGDSQGDACDADDDNDEIADGADNCSFLANSNQLNTDDDGQGDACDPDDDNDTVPDATDNCPLAANTDQLDTDSVGTDGDHQGDACDPDDDNDTVPDATDNCPLVSNADQSDADIDLVGDACDADDDNDGVLDISDNCVFTPNPEQADTDLDAVGDLCDADDDNDGVGDDGDNCQFTENPDQANIDGDNQGDACDGDDDGDGVGDGLDNCAVIPNADQANFDGDSYGDACDPDGDGDGVTDIEDNCQLNANPSQADLDGDDIGDACDADLDQDGVGNETDNCPVMANPEQEDADQDGQGDVCDNDVDGDGVGNETDNCQSVANANQADADQDGQGDVCDNDVDGDGVGNETDNCQSVANANQADADQDGQGDVCDGDEDGDGAANTVDNCPSLPNADQHDTDGDGAGDACDSDLDGDTVINAEDNCVLVVNADQADYDGDRLGDACDPDDDNDTVGDSGDNCPLIANPSQQDVDYDGQGDACDSDSDNDGVANASDLCAATPADTVVEPSTGCSVAQLVPCEGPRGTTLQWKNHGQYVSSVSKTAESFLRLGLITPAQKDAYVSAAANSSCGQ